MTNQPSEPLPCEVILLTALPVEFQAVIRHTQDVQEVVHPSGTIYHLGTFASAQHTWRIAVAEIGMGGTAAATEAEKAISFFHPQIALFVGIAGGLKDVQRGDVVVATKVYAYEAGKAGSHFEPRPSLDHTSHALEQRARVEAHNKEWQARLVGHPLDPAPRVFIGPIAAGEKVLSSTESSFARFLKHTYGDALAIEMEGHGFLHAVRLNHAVHGLVIRGISDLIDDKARTDASGMQAAAAQHAAAFAFQVLAKFMLPPSGRRADRTPPVMLPPHTQSFVGREEELSWLLQQLTDDAGKTLGLCGPGGMGKIALVAETLMRFIAQQEWPAHFPGGIFYHSFYTFPSLAIAFEELARFLKEEPGADPHRAARRALGRRRTLLVFDGLEVLDDTLPLREFGGRHVVLLLSRRRSDMPDLAHRRDLQLLPAEQGIELLQLLADLRAIDLPNAERIVQQMGCYPQALQLIGSYLSTRQEEMAEYLRWFEHEGLLSLHYGKHQAQSIPVLLERTYNVLTEMEQQVFVLLGLLAPAPFPFELVQSLLEMPEQTVQQALGALVNFSVLRRPDQGYEVSHPLIHTFAKERFFSSLEAMSSPITLVWKQRLFTTLLMHFEQSDPYEKTALTLWSPHVVPLLSVTDLTTLQRLGAARMFHAVGFAATTQGKYAEAEPLYQQALTIREQELGRSHPDVAQSLNSLALLYIHQGKYAEAEPLLQRALAIRGQELGENHPDVAQSLNSLAKLFYHRGKHEQAEPLYQRALAIREQVLGGSHPDTAQSLNNLALLYTHQGKYADAESLYQKVLTIRDQAGMSHPLTASVLNNFAKLYRSKGQYEKAESLLQRTLAIREQELGENHPDIAQSLNNLAELYSYQGKYREAQLLYQRALAIYEQQLGQDHPHTQTVRGNYTSLPEMMGREQK